MNTTPQTLDQLVTTAQHQTLEPEPFQSAIIEHLTRALLRPNRPPCLLRAPTGSGKTFMLARTLAQVSAQEAVIWFWFVPFVNLVAQTLDALVSNSSDLSAVLLAQGRNQDLAPGQVMIATAQSVAKAQWRKQGYHADGDDDTRTLAEWVARARVKPLRIGLVVDEAHIALDKTTEFGHFARWLNPDYLIMATATPKDQRLLDFLLSAGRSQFELFTVSRDEVVAARLNKRYIEAIIYDLRQSIQGIADLKRTVLRQAWKRSQRLKRQFAAAGIPLTPLLLVQVANGEHSVDQAERDLIQLCRVHPGAIGKHSADEPDPVLMAAIANDTSKEVLIFKQSAGTGFDAPRAFVLASTKPVNDPDFAMQFIGRVMRVTQALRHHYTKRQTIPADFDTAYIYLANAEAQSGFEAAVLAASQIKSQLEGQTEKLITRKTAAGAVVVTNRTTPQAPLAYDLPVLDQFTPPPHAETNARSNRDPEQPELFAATDDELDELVPEPKTPRTAAWQPATEAELIADWQQHGIRAYPRRDDLPNVPLALKQEARPEMTNMSAISENAAARLEISETLGAGAVKMALHRLQETELHTELTTRRQREEQVQIVMDRNALAQETMQRLRQLPQVEDEDCKIIIKVLTQRLLARVEDAFADLDRDEPPDPKQLQRHARDAAHWIALRQADYLAEAIHQAIADQSQLIDAAPLPDAMLFPAELPLTASRKNLYGVMPPDKKTLEQVEQVLLVDDRALLKQRDWQMETQRTYRTDHYDGSAALNGDELAFAQALDRANFVAWWHRNPDRKSYSVRLVRGEHRHFFYPDFVVCLEHFPGDAPIMRLIETKEDVKDAARKAQHSPAWYGKVLFLTKDGDSDRWRWINDDGSLGSAIDLDDLANMREWLCASRPMH